LEKSRAISIALSQVTIGNTEKPVEGALLQLKNIDRKTNGEANSTKGLMLPRVLIKDINKLDPVVFSSGTDVNRYSVRCVREVK